VGGNLLFIIFFSFSFSFFFLLSYQTT